MHKKVVLEKGKQIRYIWYSIVHLKESKTTMKCIECNRGLYRDQGVEFWSHHITLGGVPPLPSKGTLKHKVNGGLEVKYSFLMLEACVCLWASTVDVGWG